MKQIILYSCIFLSIIAMVYSLVHCDDKMSCFDNQTCCQMADDKWGCCHFANAQCCDDHKTCCP